MNYTSEILELYKSLACRYAPKCIHRRTHRGKRYQLPSFRKITHPMTHSNTPYQPFTLSWQLYNKLETHCSFTASSKTSWQRIYLCRTSKRAVPLHSFSSWIRLIEVMRYSKNKEGVEDQTSNSSLPLIQSRRVSEYYKTARRDVFRIKWGEKHRAVEYVCIPRRSFYAS